MNLVFAFVTGAIFSVGLLISGMSDPAVVLGFLDFFAGWEQWDSRLAWVLAGAVATTFVGYRLALKRPAPLFAAEFSIPSASIIDSRLLVGAVLFGLGWGLVGLCPGPALLAAVLAPLSGGIFLIAMLLGAFVARRIL